MYCALEVAECDSDMCKTLGIDPLKLQTVMEVHGLVPPPPDYNGSDELIISALKVKLEDMEV